MFKWFKTLFDKPEVGDLYFHKGRNYYLEVWHFKKVEVIEVIQVGRNKIRAKRARNVDNLKTTTEHMTLYKKDLKNYVKNNKFKSKLDVFKAEIDKIKNDK